MAAAWVVGAMASGLVVGAIEDCGDRGVLGLAVVPAVLQTALAWRFRFGVAWLWAVATCLGVLASFYITYAAIIAIGFLVFLANDLLVAAGVLSRYGAPESVTWLTNAVWFALALFVGGSAVGLAQLTALSRTVRRMHWVLTTMAGSIALAPIILPLTSSVSKCDYPPGVPHVVGGVVGGAIYGLLTAIPLWKASARPRPPRPAPRAPR